MVVNEKALVRQMKEAYKNQGYTVAVHADMMAIMAGFWLVMIDVDNVPNEVLSLIALHMRLIPENGDAYRVVKGDDGPIVQKKIADVVMEPVSRMEEEIAAAYDDGGPCWMKRTNLRYDECNVWQGDIQNGIYLIDPRYEALIANKDSVSKVGNGIYADGEISRVWVLRVDNKAADAHLRHLALIQWVTK